MTGGWRRLAMTALAGACVLVGGCGDEVLTVDEFERSAGVPAPVQPVIDAGAVSLTGGEAGFGATATPTEPPGDAGPPIGFGDGAAVVERAMADVPGEQTLLGVILFDGYAVVTLFDLNGGTAERVVVRKLAAGAPATIAGPTVDADEAQSDRFAVTDVDWSVIPGLVERTPAALGRSDARVTHVIVERNLPFTPDVVIRVYTEAGRIDHAADGRPVREFRN